jgi:tyrosinase
MTERYVRPDVRALEGAAAGTAWDERMLAYARAVEVMRARGPEDPASWIAQATLHADRPRGTWLFLPWLRMYLWFLERIMRAIVVEGGGPDDWALPFWSYADGDATLPAAFRAPALPDGTPNPLHRADGRRAPGLDAGAPLPAAVTSPARALAARTFSPGFGGVPAGPGAGGEPTPPGLLELQPHDSVTAALGADAAFDPVFPLHLAQIDLLWEAWLRRGGGRANPVQFDWTDQAFAFVDADGRGRDLTCGQVGDLVNLDYAYAGLPLPARTERVLRAGADTVPVAAWPGGGRPIAACEGDGVELGAEPRRVALHRSPAHAGRAGARVYLCLEDAEAAAVPGSVWEVRVERADGGNGPDRAAAVGTIAFPCRCPSRRFVLDVTEAVADLGAEALAVSFHPALPAGFGLAPGPAARVGRVVLTDG